MKNKKKDFKNILYSPMYHSLADFYIKNCYQRYDHQEKINFIKDFYERINLNIWEKEFIQSIDNKKRITKKQFEKLTEIYNKVKKGILKNVR